LIRWTKGLISPQKESLVVENDLRQWQPDLNALKILWKKELKNHIITQLLDDQDRETIKTNLSKIYSSRLKRVRQNDF
jgi:carboxyl-terminal processing protease